MHQVTPKVFLVGETAIDSQGLQSYLDHIDASEWKTDAPSDGEKLVEAMGRLCYRSWFPEMNPNVTKVREGNAKYLSHIISVGHGCYDAETDVLTTAGWKSWPDVQESDLLATLTKDGSIEYHKPLRLIAHNHKGQMYRVEAQGVDLLVTPDHKMLVCPTTTIAGRRRENYRLISAHELGQRSHAYTKTGNWKFSETEQKLSGDILALLGFAIGDGSIPECGYKVIFRLRKERKITWLLSLLQRLGWACTQNEDRYRVRIPEELIDLFREIYNDDHDKIIPQNLLTNCNKNQLERLFEGLMQSDGHKGRTGDSYDTTSTQLVGQIQQLCLHIGIAANVCYTLTKERRLSSFGDRPLTRLSIIRRCLKPEVNKFSGYSGRTYWIEDWEGDVFCAEVPNNTLYVRRNGIPVWSGNSVLEHGFTNWIFADISRTCTHEIVRHRVGTAFSQESLRFVRLTDLGLWMPPEVKNDPQLSQLFKETFESLEQLQLRMAELLNLDNEKEFARKKQMTSAMRRIAPIGLATTLGISMNFRTLRHLIFMRTSRHAEVEIRWVFDQVARICKQRWPNLFADFEPTKGPDGEPWLLDGAYEWTTPHVKV